MSRINSVQGLIKIRNEILSRRKNIKRVISVCSGTECIAHKSENIANELVKQIEKRGLEKKIEIRRTGTHCFGETLPFMVIGPQKICYFGMKIEDVPEIVEKSIKNDKVIERLLYKDSQTGERVKFFDEIPYYKYQKRILLANNAIIDPCNIEDYISVNGYSALAKVLSKMSQNEVQQMIKDSNLRGRGGGGFPTGRKWETTHNAPENPKYVIVNADEGDPGAYMDRGLLEGNPHGVIEGLIIGAYTIGSHDGYIYLREEYPLALTNTRKAIEQAREYGLLGNNILGTGFDFDITIHRGAGAFVSGESSALMNAIEGNVGEPRPKYIHTSVMGLWDKPSCLNNVETWANVPFIINNGVKWFKGMGTERSKGTKIFSLVGKVNNTGLVEVPMGMTLRDIIFKIGSGVPNGKKFKAVQTGGPSGGVIPESLLDLPVDFDELTKAGSMMGSGGMIVMDEGTCMVDTARYYTDFLAMESCGKCVPCREGLRQMKGILNNIASGLGKQGDIELLEELAETMQDASLCALGQTAANPVLSTIKYFRDEYEAHITEKRCPACVCSALIQYEVDIEKCKACGICFKNCPAGAIKWEKKQVAEIIREKCIKCGACIISCPKKFNAVKKVPAATAVAVP